MDTNLVKTFLEVASCGSFGGAADRLFISHSAVSLRIKSLERQLGRRVFIRNKSGIQLSPAGQQFIRYANSFLMIWEEAKQQVAVPEEYEDVLVVAGEYGLWNRLLIRWLPELAKAMPNIAFRAEVARFDRITRQMVEGTIDIAVMYTPQIRPGLELEYLFNDNMVMISSRAETDEIDHEYVFIDWGEEFSAFHAYHFPDYLHPRMTFNLGQISLNYLLNNHGSAYMPLRLVAPYIETKKLYLVEGMPEFQFPVHVAWRAQLDVEIAEQAFRLLKETVSQSISGKLPPPFWANS